MEPLALRTSFAFLVWAVCVALLPAQRLAPDVDPDAGEECTVGVASGRATADGRPLLWKNRDTTLRHNVVRRFDDGKTPYIALCDATSSASVWGGVNAAGFCIMNSVSRDLPGRSASGPSNGPFMKLALRECATVDEFEALLVATNASGRRTKANFGVVDAHGGAAVFEVGHATFVRFDADADAAGGDADGVVVRANFATTAKGTAGRGRHARAEAVCRALPDATKLDHRFLLREFVRDLTPTGNGDDASAPPAPAGRLDVRETIHRQSTVAALVFHGVRPGEDARWTTMWTVLGQPLVSVAVPCFAAATSVAPVLDAAPRSRLCDAAIAIQERVYEVAAPEGDTAASRGGAGDDVVAGPPRWLLVDAVAPVQAVTLPVEDAILAATAAALRRWRAAGAAFDPVALTRHHEAAAVAACAAVELALASAPSPVAAEAPTIGR